MEFIVYVNVYIYYLKEPSLEVKYRLLIKEIYNEKDCLDKSDFCEEFCQIL